MIYLFALYVGAMNIPVNVPLATFDDLHSCEMAANQWQKIHKTDVAACSKIKQGN